MVDHVDSIACLAARDAHVDQSLVGAAADRLATPPAGEYVWFLEPAGVEDYWMTASTLGLIGELRGEVTTVRNVDSGLVDEEFADVTDVVEEVEELPAVVG